VMSSVRRCTTWLPLATESAATEAEIEVGWRTATEQAGKEFEKTQLLSGTAAHHGSGKAGREAPAACF